MLNIAIDGHVGSGKSTLAFELAKRLNLKVLDTGAIYRSIACEYKKKFGSNVCQNNLKELINDIKIEIKFIDNQQHVLINNNDYFQYLRTEEISLLSSQISPYVYVREKVLALQRNFAKSYDCVMEGRDIGTVVLPSAQYKFFITASEQERAKRRYEQLKIMNISYEKVLEDLRVRDYNDEHREVAPLKPAKDAIILDTTNLTLDQTVQKCIDIIKKDWSFIFSLIYL